jgi:hypothetical protein
LSGECISNTGAIQAWIRGGRRAGAEVFRRGLVDIYLIIRALSRRRLGAVGEPGAEFPGVVRAYIRISINFYVYIIRYI